MIQVTPSGQFEVHLHGRGLSFPNVVLDVGWQNLLARNLGNADGEIVPKWLWFGLGDDDPAPGQTGLQDRQSIGKYATSVEYRGQIDGGRQTAWHEAVVRFDFEPGELTGLWSEVGLSYDSEYADPYNRALIMDENRVPIPMIVPEYMGATVYARLRLYLGGWGQAVSIGDLYNGTVTIATNAVGSSGLWVKGLPNIQVIKGGITASRIQPSPDAVFRWQVGPLDSPWSFSMLSLRGRSSTEMMRIDLDDVVTVGKGWTYNMDLGINFSRGEI